MYTPTTPTAHIIFFSSRSTPFTFQSSLNSTMKFSHRFSTTTTTTTILTHKNDQNIPTSTPKTINIPVMSPDELKAATKIQSAYRMHRIRTHFKTIATVNSEADQMQRTIQRQETVDSIRSDEREKLRINESLMRMLLKLDSVPGVDPTVREARRKVSHRIVSLQEVLDSVVDERIVGADELMWQWEEVVEDMESDVVWGENRRSWGVDRDREMERFCLETLGFRCMERFLRGV